MGTQLVKQPNGLYARFSSGTDSITHYDMTSEEYVALRVKEAARLAVADAQRAIEGADKYGTSAPQPFDMSWEEAYKIHLERGYAPIELKVSETPTVEETIALGKESLRLHHPSLYDEIMREEAEASARLDGETHVVEDPETCPHDDFETEGATHCSKCGKDMRFYPRPVEEAVPPFERQENWHEEKSDG